MICDLKSTKTQKQTNSSSESRWTAGSCGFCSVILLRFSTQTVLQCSQWRSIVYGADGYQSLGWGFNLAEGDLQDMLSWKLSFDPHSRCGCDGIGDKYILLTPMAIIPNFWKNHCRKVLWKHSISRRRWTRNHAHYLAPLPCTTPTWGW
eukprot:gene24613-206_t